MSKIGSKKPSAKNSPPPITLEFDGATPVAPQGLAGMHRDLFGNGRMFATVGAHGGLLRISYWGQQHLGGSGFFQADAGSAWIKLMRMHILIDGKRHYLLLNNTRLYPFGYRSECEIDGVKIEHELLLLPDAIVQRAKVVRNPRKVPVQLEVLHHEDCTAIGIANRTWADFAFDKKRNALVTSCRDENPTVYRGGDTLSQRDLVTLGIEVHDAPKAETWIGIGCDLPLAARRGFHERSKHYLTSKASTNASLAFYMVFGSAKDGFEKRLKQLPKSVHVECEELVDSYERRVKNQPQVDVGNAALNSFFMQQPEMLHAVELPDRPGAFKAALAGYFLWGWDGMTPTIPCALANAPESTAAILRFWQSVCHPQIGIPLQLTTAFETRLNNAFPPQCQYICGLYHYVSTTGDLSLVKEVLPTCEFILEQCRKGVVKNTGLVAGTALWPDFPEAMEEDGNDISSLNNSLMYQGLRAMEYLYAALDRKDDSMECGEWAKRLRASFVKYLYDEEKGYFISSCSAKNLKPRKHYVSQAIFWITPFARELVSHAPDRIAAFMDEHLRSAKCLLSMPRWDTAWMADGNQLGASFPPADYFYINVHKVIGDAKRLEAWLGDVEWFWQRHTVPESFTPEAENEHEVGADNQGCKQPQAISTWYASLYMGLAGMDFDHEGITLTPWGDRDLSISNLKLRGVSIDLKISGSGNHIGSLKLNGKMLPAGSRKIAWATLKGKSAKIALVRSEAAPKHPVIVRADGLRIFDVKNRPGSLTAQLQGEISGEVVVASAKPLRVWINDQAVKVPFDRASKTLIIPVPARGCSVLKISI
jgi:hypothetical protein